jgi:uncharacterized membrane protein SpoIIM required for sporulation
VFLVSYTHAVFEIPAMILSFTFSLILIDDVNDIFHRHHYSDAEIQIKIFIKNFMKFLIILAVILIIAAFFETQITPHLIQASFEDYFRTFQK